MLNTTKDELDLTSDAEMYLLFEEGKRGGVSHISKGYSKANNKYLKSYDPKQQSKHITYLDANNLHGYAMHKFFPAAGFRLLDPKRV